jgi:hypothetical protein
MNPTNPQQPTTLYHYTTRERAEEVLRDLEEPGVYAEISNGLYGPGFYALDLAPEAADRERLRWECFEDSRPAHPMDGLLVLDLGLSDSPFDHQDRHIWLLAVDPGSERPPSIGHMVLAVGIWEGGGWQLTDLS